VGAEKFATNDPIANSTRANATTVDHKLGELQLTINNQAYDLTVDKPWKRELQGEETHEYQLKLSEGSFLDLAIDQEGSDVVVQLYKPQAPVLLEVDDCASGLPEQVRYVALQAGEYRLKVALLEPPSTPQHYTLRLRALRPASVVDQALAASGLMDYEANQLASDKKYPEAVALRQKQIALLEQTFPPEHAEIGAAISDLALLYHDMGDYSQAEAAYLRSVDIQEKALGLKSGEFAVSLNNVGIFYYEIGEYAKSEMLYKRALAIWEDIYGPDHFEVSTALNNLANIYSLIGDYTQAEALLQRSLAIREKLLLDKDSLNIALAYSNLANVYSNMGEYQKGVELVKKAIVIREKNLGKHQLYANSVGHLASLYRGLGDYSLAKELTTEVLTVREQTLGPMHPEIVDSLRDLATVNFLLGDYAQSEKVAQQGLVLQEKTLGREHPNYAQLLICLARVHIARKEYRFAEPLLQQALEILEKKFGRENVVGMVALEDLARAYRYQGNLGAAAQVLQEALAIGEKLLAAEHPFVVDNLADLAEVALQRGRASEALRYQITSNERRERELLKTLVIGSERQKLNYLKLSATEQDFTLSLHLQQLANNQQAANIALTTLLRRKGRALDVMTDSINNLRRYATPADQQLLDELAQGRGQLANLTLKGAGPEGVEKHQAMLQQLQQKIDSLEQQISNRSVEFRVQTQPVTVETVQRALPKDGVLLEFASYRPYQVATQQYDAAHYAVYVLYPDGQVKWADLGAVAQIDEAINLLRQQLTREKGQPLSNLKSVKAVGRQLDRLLMQPVRQLLAADSQANNEKLTKKNNKLTRKKDNSTTNNQFVGRQRLLISPDGRLNFVPFDALVDERGHYLIEQYDISYLTSGRDLLRLQTGATSQQPPMVFANPAYGDGQGPLLAGQAAGRLSELYGAQQEARRIKAALPQAQLYLQTQATEQALKQVQRPQILHIATHGYFLDHPTTLVNQTVSNTTRGIEYIPTTSELDELRRSNPLLRSWLFFAGANGNATKIAANVTNPTRNDSSDAVTKGVNALDAAITANQDTKLDDGILTALEAAALNLFGTKLVVLSACQTGLGEIQNGEGVYGLRRALVIAGAESQLTSLWAIDDAATRDLMGRYYELLRQGAGRHAALRQVQLEFLMATPNNRKTSRAHPYYWAGFVLSGEWGTLEGKR
jgi:CHAT domain-containing protein